MNRLHRYRNRLRRALGGAPRLPVLTPQQGYDRWAATYGEAMNPVQTLEHDALQRLLPDLRGRRVLDLGCGTGRVTRLALDRGARETVGVDLSEPMLREAEATVPSPDARWVRAGARDLPFSDAAFDTVVTALMMGHVADLDGALAEIACVLRPGGFLVLTDFHPYATLRGDVRSFTDAATGRAFAIEHHLHLFNDYVRGLHATGLVLETLEEPRYYGLPLVFALRARKQP